jgi:CubicO group peptidase (beta-lactamase class C family)
MQNNSILIAASILALSAGTARGQQQPDPAQSPVVLVVPGMAEAKVERDIVYATPSTGPLRFDFYQPARRTTTEALPAVVFVSGGEDVRAWKWYESYGRIAAAKSFVGIVPAKRYPRGFDGLRTATADTDSLLAYLRANAPRLGIDPNRICVWVFSAGGRLSSVALKSAHSNVRCIVAFYPVMDLSAEFAVVADTVQRRALLEQYSPSHVLRARGANAPPVFLARAGKDGPGINTSIDRFLDAAKAVNASVTFVDYPDGVHGFDAYNDTDESRRIIEAAFGFIGTRTSTPDRSITAEIDRFADSVVRSVPVAGLSIVVSRGSKTLVSRGYGVADVKTNRPMTDVTAYRIGSITKTFTAIAIMKLVEQGRIDLDDPLSKYRPDIAAPTVTIRQLLNHTSGLPDHEGGAIERWMTQKKPITHEYVLGVVKEKPARPAGKAWMYNNTGFHLLGMVIEKVSGTPYHEFIRREIAGPARLTATWLDSARPPGSATENYYLIDNKFVRDSVWDLPGIFSAGGMYSSARDLARLVSALIAGRIVSAESVSRMTQPTVLPTGVSADYGLGVRLGNLAGHPKWGHTGSARSNRAGVAYYPRDSLTVVVLMNTEHEDIPISAIDIEGRVARIVLGISSVRRSDLKLSPGTSRVYTGTYTDERVRSLIAERDGVLQLSRVGSTGAAIPLLYQGGEEFADPEYAEFRFVFQKHGVRAIAFSRYDNGWFVGVRSRIE